MRFRKRFSKTAKREFAIEMEEIRSYCDTNNIKYSKSMDSYYFRLNDKNYRVSNHTVESRNSETSVFFRGHEVDATRESNTVYITASKTRLIEIYKALLEGKELDARGRVKNDN